MGIKRHGWSYRGILLALVVATLVGCDVVVVTVEHVDVKDTCGVHYGSTEWSKKSRL